MHLNNERKIIFFFALYSVFITFAAVNQKFKKLWTIIRRKLLNSKAGGTAGKTANPLATIYLIANDRLSIQNQGLAQ